MNNDQKLTGAITDGTIDLQMVGDGGMPQALAPCEGLLFPVTG